MVPSHEASECNANPLSMLINEITYFHPESNGSQALIRFKTIVPQKKCSIREEHVHLDSICVPNKKVIEGKNVIFVQEKDGFEKREVSLGRSDGTFTEVLSGIKAGEKYAASNTFILKAELGKSEAEHEH